MPVVDVLMPKMGESITEGTVITWYKKVGEAVAQDEILLEIGTDKVDTEIPASDAGILAEILVEEGTTVDVGTPIARIQVGTTAATPPPAVPQPASTASPSAASAAAPSRTATTGSTSKGAPRATIRPAPTATEPVIMPKMGESITEGTVIAWYKEPGDAVALDETILEIGTDKVDTDVPSPAKGTLQEILVPAGETVAVGTLIAIIATDEAVNVATAEAVSSEGPEDQVDGAQEKETPSDGRHLSDGRFLTPLVRSIAQQEGISTDELVGIKGSGSRGRINKKDLLDYIAARKRPPTTAAPERPLAAAAPEHSPKVTVPRAAGPREEVIEMDRMRQLVAHHMTLSRKTAAHVTSFAEVDATNLVRLRETHKHAFLQQDGIKLTYTPFLVYAVVEALRDHPILNASVEGTSIIIKKDYHIGVAVNIDKTGLIVPVIKHAGRQRVAGLAHAAHNLAARARANELNPDDLQGGTFTLTNLGSLGSIMGTPIILQPQVAILATGAIKKRPVVVEDPALGDVIAIRHMMYLSLSYDHRIIDGAMGISFLRKFASVVESFDPTLEI